MASLGQKRACQDRAPAEDGRWEDANGTVRDDVQEETDIRTFDAAQRLFRDDNHIILGSPRANSFTEAVVSRIYGATPRRPRELDKFPYGFMWDSYREIPSAFGCRSRGAACGVYSTASRKVVAPYREVERGTGTDAAIVLVRFMYANRSTSHYADRDRRVLIALLGYGGLGTYGAARAVVDPDMMRGMYPPRPEDLHKVSGVPNWPPLMRPLRIEYTREPARNGYDNRVFQSVSFAE